MVIQTVSKLALIGMMVGLHGQLPVSSALKQRTPFEEINPDKSNKHLQRILGDKLVSTLNPLERYAAMENYINDYVTTKLARRGFESRSTEVIHAIFRTSAKYQIDPLFIVSMIEQESQFDIKAFGRHGEIGLLQIKPVTAAWAAKKLGLKLESPEALWNPETNLDISVAYLKHLQGVFYRLPLSHLDAYNRGTGSVLKLQASGQTNPTEYSVSIIQRLTKHYKALSGTIAQN